MVLSIEYSHPPIETIAPESLRRPVRWATAADLRYISLLKDRIYFL